jgi:hypothetical protein
MVAVNKNHRKSMKRGGSASASGTPRSTHAQLAKRLRALRGESEELDFEDFFRNVEQAKTRFYDVTFRGSDVSFSLKRGEKAQTVSKYISDGRLNILLLNNTSLFGRSIKEMFINNQGLIFYRSVYVEHLLKMMDILDKIEVALDKSFTEPKESKTLKTKLESFRLKLELQEEEQKTESSKVFEDESALITKYYEEKTHDKRVLELRTRSLLAIQRKLKGYKKKNKDIQMRMFRQLRRHRYYIDRLKKKSVPDMSTTVCNVAKLLLYDNDKTRSHIVYNGVKYPTQKYNNKDSNSDVITKISQVLGFARDNDQFLIDSENDLSTKAKRQEYLAKLESRGGCNSLIIMLKFFDKSDGGGGGRSIADNSGLSSLELPDVPIDALTLGLPDVTQFNSLLGLPSVATETPRTPRTVLAQKKATATALPSRLGSKKNRKRKRNGNKLRKTKGTAPKRSKSKTYKKKRT